MDRGELTRGERVEGGVLGLLVGDALGVPYEFHVRAEIPPLGVIELDPPRSFPRAHPRTPVGTWSDDGAHALCLLASLLENDGLDLDDLGRRLIAWYRDGEMAVDGIVFDVGIQTEQAIHRLIEGTPAAEAGATDERANGNGSLMRALPLALFHRGSDAELVHDAHAQSLVTHAHARSQVACALYVLWARNELAGAPDAWDQATRALRGVYRANGMRDHADELEDEVIPGFAQPRGTGYVVDCLHSARAACASASYEATVKLAVALGNDTDTTATVAGGIAGVRHGARGIPTRWLDRLRGRDIVDPLLLRAMRAWG